MFEKIRSVIIGVILYKEIRYKHIVKTRVRITVCYNIYTFSTKWFKSSKVTRQ